MNKEYQTLQLKYLGINTYKEPIIYMRDDSYICRAEGFGAQARIRVTRDGHSIIATLNTVQTELLRHNEAGLSNYAWELLNAKEGDKITVSHPKLLDSLSYIRSKIYGNELSADQLNQIIKDIVSGQLSDIHIAMFVAATVGHKLTTDEVHNLTQAMVDSGQRITWPSEFVVDKHCVGGLPGNRTTPIVVAIVAAYGLTMPKTSSRAITSPAGTADTMEVFAPVTLDVTAMKKVVEKENGCIVWGGAVALSPADDLLIRIERAADLDSEGQLVASILSKKIAAGASHTVIDIPIGTTAKVRSLSRAEHIKSMLEYVADSFGLNLKVIFTDGAQPIGKGIGPALEARDVLAVLECAKDAPKDLRERALLVAGHVLELSPNIKPNEGLKIATEILDSGKALKKFKAICEAQGGMREIPKASFTHVIESTQSGKILNIDNRHIARIAKLAGAPDSKAAGIELHLGLNSAVEKSQPLFTVHAESQGELNYALDFINQGNGIFQIGMDG